MKLASVVSLLAFISCLQAAYAQTDNSVFVQQMPADSTLKALEPAKAPTPEDIKKAQQQSIADQLTHALKDYKVTQIGRANQAVSSQYGGQPIGDGAPTNSDTPQDATNPQIEINKANSITK